MLSAVFRAAHADAGEFIVAEFFAGFGASLADVRACRANDGVKARMAQHEIMRGVTELGTV